MSIEPRFRPSDVERLAGVDPDTQRDWRRRGFLDEYGEAQGSGRWAYTLRDMIGFYVARRLMATGMIRQDASAIGFVHSPIVEAVMQGRPASYRFAVRALDASQGEQDQRFEKFERLGGLDQTAFDRAEVIDLWWLAVTAPPELLEVVRLYAPEVPD